MNPISIPFVSLNSREKQLVMSAILSDLQDLVSKSQFILGDVVADFERRFADLCDSQHGVGVNSGLDALILSLRALGVGPGDEVITTPNSFVASAAAIELVGAQIVFVDVGLDFNIDVDKIAEACTKRTAALLPVHLTGSPCRMDRILEISEERDLWVVEDAAQAVGATLKGKKVGAWGDVGCFSLHPLKNLHVWGDGGMVVTSDTGMADRLRLQRNHGLKSRDEADFFSYNSRLDAIQAVVATHYLKLLGSVTDCRRKNAAFFSGKLGRLNPEVVCPIHEPNAEPVYHVYQLRVKQRDGLRAHLQKAGIETKIHYPIPLHLQRASAHLGYEKGDFPVTERLSEEILSLPVRENLTVEERERIAYEVLRFYGAS